MSDAPKPPKRPGRPALPPERGKRYALGFRTTKELRDSLQQAADSSGRSLAQEIEFRLEQTFAAESASVYFVERLVAVNEVYVDVMNRQMQSLQSHIVSLTDKLAQSANSLEAVIDKI